MKTVVLCGIDSSGKTTLAKHIQSIFPNTFIKKYPDDKEIKGHIDTYYHRLINSGKELHESAILNMYRQVHDLYDRDFRIPFTVPEKTELLLFDRYFVDNVVHSRINNVERDVYGEGHHFIPDLVILLRVRNYSDYKKKFKLKGDENIREPAILFHEVYPEYINVISELAYRKRIKQYTIVDGLENSTNSVVSEKIKELLSISSSPRTLSTS